MENMTTKANERSEIINTDDGPKVLRREFFVKIDSSTKARWVLKKIMRESGLSAREFIEKTGIGETAIYRCMKGGFGITPLISNFNQILRICGKILKLRDFDKKATIYGLPNIVTYLQTKYNDSPSQLRQQAGNRPSILDRDMQFDHFLNVIESLNCGLAITDDIKEYNTIESVNEGANMSEHIAANEEYLTCAEIVEDIAVDTEAPKYITEYIDNTLRISPVVSFDEFVKSKEIDLMKEYIGYILNRVKCNLMSKEEFVRIMGEIADKVKY